MPTHALLILDAGFALWFLPFLLTGYSRRQPAERDPRWRRGLWLQIAAFLILWAGPFWLHPISHRRIAVALVFLALACLLSWTATRALGRHLRFQAALDADHQLVQTGPYRFVRHPIYASMFAMLLASAAMVATPVRLLLAIVLFIAGTEIRIHYEEALLLSHFGDQYAAYRRTTRGYIPFLR